MPDDTPAINLALEEAIKHGMGVAVVIVRPDGTVQAGFKCSEQAVQGTLTGVLCGLHYLQNLVLKHSVIEQPHQGNA